MSEENEEKIETEAEAEISRRVQEIRDGTAKGRPAEEVLSEIRARYQ